MRVAPLAVAVLVTVAGCSRGDEASDTTVPAATVTPSPGTVAAAPSAAPTPLPTTLAPATPAPTTAVAPPTMRVSSNAATTAYRSGEREELIFANVDIEKGPFVSGVQVCGYMMARRPTPEWPVPSRQ